VRVNAAAGLLDNVFWHALTGPQAHAAAGSGAARRYAPGFSPIVAFADARQADFDALRPCCERGEHFYCDGWTGAPPAGWRIEREATMVRMLWDAPPPQADAASDAMPLGAAHVPLALELARLTQPGPFGPRTLELGDYLGLFVGTRLIAMAGERAHAGTLREVSGVCTHPEFQGRGLARRLMLELVRRELLRGETPLLHVMSANAGARALYARIGFREVSEVSVRVVSRL
jgi:ribosomal protein S18 acetylase RimI-like enzyme